MGGDPRDCVLRFLPLDSNGDQLQEYQYRVIPLQVQHAASLYTDQ